MQNCRRKAPDKIVYMDGLTDSHGDSSIPLPLVVGGIKILDVTILKAFPDNKSNIANMTIFLYDKSRKHCGKGRKCWLPAFSPFLTVFSKALLF